MTKDEITKILHFHIIMGAATLWKANTRKCALSRYHTHTLMIVTLKKTVRKGDAYVCLYCV